MIHGKVWLMVLAVVLVGPVLAENVRYGTGATWCGQVTRHRMSDGFRSPASIHENQKLNAKFPGFNANLNDFAPIQFRE